VKRELRDKLLEITDAEAQRRGLEGLHSFVDQACIVFQKLAEVMEPLRTREGIIGVLDRVEMTEEEEHYAVPTVKHFGHVIREALTELFELGLNDLPQAPSGRKRKLTQKLSEQICAHVLNLLGKGADLTTCKKRAAQKFGVSYTTVQRAWGKRGKTELDEIDLSELIQYVRTRLVREWIPKDAGLEQIAKSEYTTLTVNGGIGQVVESDCRPKTPIAR
jgi:hypothetical protein